MPVLTGIGYLASCREEGGQGEIHPLRRAALVWSGSRIQWAGPERDLPRAFQDEPAEDLEGRMVIPGLIDCHTHLAFGGWRADEFESRLQGRSYLDIARGGGGILATVRKTRQASEDELVHKSEDFLARMAALGICTVECKSGYGLDLENELKLLRVYRRLSESQGLRIMATLLGAHAVPPESTRQAYVEFVCNALIPEVSRRNLAQFCDVFVEETAFDREDARRIAAAAEGAGLGLKLHVDQLGDGGGAALAAELGAVSADHLEHISEAGIRALAASRVVAVSLPLAALYLGVPALPARRLIEAGVPVAVASDFNPGSAPSYHLPLALLLACLQQRMLPAEALKGATIYAARALGLDRLTGSLEPGKAADFAVIEAEDPAQWIYHFRANACVRTYVGGRPVRPADSGWSATSSVTADRAAPSAPSKSSRP